MARVNLGRIRTVFKGEWAANAYEVDDVVLYAGSAYTCIAVAASGNDPTDTAFWIKSAAGIEFVGAWDTSVTYKVDQIVTFNGSTYIAIVAHTGTQPTATGQTSWGIIVEGFKFEGAWDVSTAYQTNDIATFSGSTYIALVDHTGVQPIIGGNASWAVFAGGFQFEGVWDTSTSYHLNDIVTFNGSTYISLTVHSGTQPTATGQTDWGVFAGGFNFEGAWNTSTAYQTNDVVTLNGSAFIAISDHTGTQPEAAGNAGWVLYASGGDIADQTGQSGKVLGTDGTSTSWVDVDALPDQTSNEGYYLRTNGSIAYWGKLVTIKGLRQVYISSGNYNFLPTQYTLNIEDEAYANKQWSLSAAPAQLSIDSSGMVTASSSLSASDVSYTVNVSDGGNANTSLDVVITSHADVPIFSGSTPSSITDSPDSSINEQSFAVTSTSSGNLVTHTISEGSLPNKMTMSDEGKITGYIREEIGTYVYTFTVKAECNGYISFYEYTWTINVIIPPGQQMYQGSYGNASCTQQTTTWTVPPGITEVDVFVMGGGGGGCYQWASCGGAGAGSTWANKIPVTPGNNMTIVYGNGGCWNGHTGGFSCFPGMIACGGCCGCQSGRFTMSSTAIGTKCGGYGMVAYPSTAGGGGGAAGYCNGCCNTATSGYSGCSGGGGSATSYASSTYGTGGGGGTGMCGQGSPGACGNAGYSHSSGSGGQGGSGGQCGKPGEPWSNGQGNGFACGGCYGGGGGGGGTSHGGGWGGPGAVRIMWGGNRSYPHNAGNL